MRIQLLFFVVLFTALTAFGQRTSAGVEIPPQQTFLLGEYADYAYKAKLENKGSKVVIVELRNKADQSVISTVQLSPKQTESFQVAADQVVAMRNPHDRKAKVNAKMSTTVVGMRYVENEEELLTPAPSESEPSLNGISIDPNASPAEENVKASISKGEAFVLGEGTSTTYSVDLKKMGGSVKVSIRDRRTSEQTQGFGLGNAGATVNLRPYEVIYLVHDGGLPARVSATFSEPVSGARVIEVE